MASKIKMDEKQVTAEVTTKAEGSGSGGTIHPESASTENGDVVDAGRKPAKEEFVEFALFKDNDKYSAPKFVGVNGKGYLIERGKPVRMPKSVFEILKNSDEQITYARQVMENMKNVEITVG